MAAPSVPGLIGLKAHLVAVEAFISPGLPAFTLIGLPDTSLAEARERVHPAVTAAGYPWPQTHVTVNLSPASLPKHGTSYDLAIALAVLSAGKWVPSSLSTVLVLGELNLDGSILPITGLLPCLLDARQRGITTVVIPEANRSEADLIPGLTYIAVSTLAQAIRRLGGKPGQHRPLIAHTTHQNDSDKRSASKPDSAIISHSNSIRPLNSAREATIQTGVQDTPTDFAEIIGQQQAKHALEIAAAGGHHLLMTGPPGVGKSLLARALPGLLPPLTDDEQLDVASIRSICGTLPRHGMSRVPPFEAPHHTSSVSALVGGGMGTAAPGAITRAHRGVLFLDEAPEFSAAALQALREPLETGEIILARSHAVTVYPARFLLVMAANPCPCGGDWGDGSRCTCTVQQRNRYWSRLSGPLLDRIDIQLEVPAPTALPASGYGEAEPSSTVRERVCSARATAADRFSSNGWSTTNSEASGAWLRQRTGSAALLPIQKGVATRILSLRGADRTLRLAWTIADLTGHMSPTKDDVAEALMLRSRRT